MGKGGGVDRSKLILENQVTEQVNKFNFLGFYLMMMMVVVM
jgi:hypothetical protein